MTGVEIPIEEIVFGDIVILNAGDIVPGDCLVQESVVFRYRCLDSLVTSTVAALASRLHQVRATRFTFVKQIPGFPPARMAYATPSAS